MNYVETCGILTESQYGFRKNHSTFLALLQLYGKISSAIDKNEFTIGIFLDLSKAFDTVKGMIVNYVTGVAALVLIGGMLLNISNLGRGVKFYATLKMQGVKFYLKNVKKGNVFISGYCKGIKILFFQFSETTAPPVT